VRFHIASVNSCHSRLIAFFPECSHRTLRASDLAAEYVGRSRAPEHGPRYRGRWTFAPWTRAWFVHPDGASTGILPLPRGFDDPIDICEKECALNRSLFAVLMLATASPISSADDIGEWRATGYAQLDNVAAVPYLTEAGRSRYQEFLKHPSPRAFVICPDGRFSTLYGGRAGVERELRTRVSGCEPYVVNDAVVWKDKNTVSHQTARIVECRDPTGRREFGQECPPGTTNVREVKASSPTGANPDAGAQGKSVRELEAEFQRRRIDRTLELTREGQQKNLAQSNCADARRRLGVLEGGRRIRLVGRSAADGGPVYMDDKARAADIALQKERLQGCGQ
jgi:hypothetical protein